MSEQIPAVEEMTKRDRAWYEKYLEVKRIGLKNLVKGTPLYRWVRRQWKMYKEQQEQGDKDVKE